LMNAQGEDVVAGTRTPLPISALERENRSAYAELVKIRRTLEQHYREMMDIEFTIQQRKLYMLQCRVGKRTAFAAIRIAVDMVRERLVSSDDGVRRVEPEELNQLLRPVFDPRQKQRAVAEERFLAKGLYGGPGASPGPMATTPGEVVRVRIERTIAPDEAPVYQLYAQLMKWADKARRLRVRANADQPDQCANALAFGAEGVGLCRTEHMFFGEGKIE